MQWLRIVAGIIIISSMLLSFDELDSQMDLYSTMYALMGTILGYCFAVWYSIWLIYSGCLTVEKIRRKYYASKIMSIIMSLIFLFSCMAFIGLLMEEEPSTQAVLLSFLLFALGFLFLKILITDIKYIIKDFKKTQI